MSIGMGGRVKLARQRAGLTQTELGQAVGCSQQTIVDIETRGVRSKFLPAIAEVLRDVPGIGVDEPIGEAVPHFDMYALAHPVPVPIDCFYGAVLPGETLFTVQVDMSTMTRSNGYFTTDDVLFCRSSGDLLTPWVIAWMRGWPKAELFRLMVEGDTMYLCEPRSGLLRALTEVCVVPSHEMADAEADPGSPLPCWIVASVRGLYRPLTG